MAPHALFRYRSLDELRADAAARGLVLPISPDPGPLLRPVEIAGREIANRLVVLPMEGADAEAGGGPSSLTRRRYLRFAEGGAGLIWSEAVAVRPDGRSNPRQLLLTPETRPSFAALVREVREAARAASGREPFLVCQITHSGRFSRPSGTPAPVIVRHSAALDPLRGIPPDLPVLSDGEIERLRDQYVRAAGLAAEAGFDAVDVKACHGYLVSELLGARERTGSRYGGPFENRTRFLRETFAAIRSERPGLVLTTRLSAGDLLPEPAFGGMGADGAPDLEEPVALAGALRDSAGLPLLLYSIGVPAFAPHVGRPFDRAAAGTPLPAEHPLEGVARHLRVASGLRRALPGTAVVAAGLSWLRQHSMPVAAGLVGEGGAALAGLGRGALAYPDFARDLAAKGRLDPRRCCTACSRCSERLRDMKPVGCAVRDAEAYPS